MKIVNMPVDFFHELPKQVMDYWNNQAMIQFEFEKLCRLKQYENTDRYLEYAESAKKARQELIVRATALFTCGYELIDKGSEGLFFEPRSELWHI